MRLYFTKDVSKSTYFFFSCTHSKVLQIVKILQCYSILKNTFKNFNLTIFMAISTSIMNKTIKTFYINLPLIPLISKKPTSLKRPEMEYEKKA